MTRPSLLCGQACAGHFSPHRCKTAHSTSSYGMSPHRVCVDVGSMLMPCVPRRPPWQHSRYHHRRVSPWSTSSPLAILTPFVSTRETHWKNHMRKPLPKRHLLQALPSGIDPQKDCSLPERIAGLRERQAFSLCTHLATHDAVSGQPRQFRNFKNTNTHTSRAALLAAATQSRRGNVFGTCLGSCDRISSRSNLARARLRCCSGVGCCWDRSRRQRGTTSR